MLEQQSSYSNMQNTNNVKVLIKVFETPEGEDGNEAPRPEIPATHSNSIETLSGHVAATVAIFEQNRLVSLDPTPEPVQTTDDDPAASMLDKSTMTVSTLADSATQTEQQVRLANRATNTTDTKEKEKRTVLGTNKRPSIARKVGLLKEKDKRTAPKTGLHETFMRPDFSKNYELYKAANANHNSLKKLKFRATSRFGIKVRRYVRRTISCAW